MFPLKKYVHGIFSHAAISRAFAIGDQRKLVSDLIIPAMDEQGKLTGPAALVNPGVSTREEAINDEKWKSYLEDGIRKAILML